MGQGTDFGFITIKSRNHPKLLAHILAKDPRAYVFGKFVGFQLATTHSGAYIRVRRFNLLAGGRQWLPEPRIGYAFLYNTIRALGERMPRDDQYGNPFNLAHLAHAVHSSEGMWEPYWDAVRFANIVEKEAPGEFVELVQALRNNKPPARVPRVELRRLNCLVQKIS